MPEKGQCCGKCKYGVKWKPLPITCKQHTHRGRCIWHRKHNGSFIFVDSVDPVVWNLDGRTCATFEAKERKQ
jgi:hypothetical protein